MKLEQVASLVSGILKGERSLEISGVRGVNDAQEGDITFLMQNKYLDALKSSKASAVLVMKLVDVSIPQIVVKKPELAFARLVKEFHPEPQLQPRTHPNAVIGNNVKLGERVTLSAGVCIGDEVSIGNDVTLYPNVVIGNNCIIDENCTIYPNVTLYRNTELGKHVIIHAGAVIGADGFGYTLDEMGCHYKINQFGRVVIEDFVEIGANSCIDRAAMDTTLIKAGTKIDNLVQVAHNCTVGEHSILVAQVGLAGSCKLGHHVVLAGQVGLADHVTLGNQVTVTAKSGTFRDLEDHAVVSGWPAVPTGTWKRYMATLPKLPDLARKVKELEARLNEIEKPIK
ncbi:MAG: UDP-3-O-(3-hydroxymyristoyl)glucosamine N-acyltransferase [Nitrospinae bacterium]|nr:UDP-3-O-(3-hydroxymyristoyl)glucosamine N-acyltransferase [Nitrospinota bacterium]